MERVVIGAVGSIMTLIIDRHRSLSTNTSTDTPSIQSSCSCGHLLQDTNNNNNNMPACNVLLVSFNFTSCPGGAVPAEFDVFYWTLLKTPPQTMITARRPPSVQWTDTVTYKSGWNNEFFFLGQYIYMCTIRKVIKCRYKHSAWIRIGLTTNRP